jgi:hypothetical protein
VADYLAIADALAARYAGVTPPSGEPALALVTFDAPDQLGPTPAILVWPNDEERQQSQESFGRYVSLTRYTARVYFERLGSFGTRMRRLAKWRTVTWDRLSGQASLGITPWPEVFAELQSITTGEATYADIAYDVLDLIHVIRIEDEVAPGV